MSGIPPVRTGCGISTEAVSGAVLCVRLAIDFARQTHFTPTTLSHLQIPRHKARSKHKQRSTHGPSTPALKQFRQKTAIPNDRPLPMGPCRRAPCGAQRHTCRDASPPSPYLHRHLRLPSLSHTHKHTSSSSSSLSSSSATIRASNNQSIKEKNGGETCPCLSESCPTPHTATHIFMLVEE